MQNRERDNQLIAQRIRQVREGLGLRKEDFAVKLDFDQTTVSKWERGKARQNPDALVRIAGIAKDIDKLFFLMHAGIPDQYFMGETMIPEIESAASHVVDRAIRGSAGTSSVQIGWDRELLTFVIETVNSKLRKRRRKLPDREYATLVAQCYEECRRSGRRDIDMMDQLANTA